MFYSIVARQPVFSTTTFSADAVATIKGLLIVDDKARLGSDALGVQKIMTSPFFAEVDFDKVYSKEVPIPFIPNVSGEQDTKYVPKTYLMAQAEDSICEAKPSASVDFDFKEFAYSGEKSEGVGKFESSHSLNLAS